MDIDSQVIAYLKALKAAGAPLEQDRGDLTPQERHRRYMVAWRLRNPDRSAKYARKSRQRRKEPPVAQRVNELSEE